jgi:hypothetical protein
MTAVIAAAADTLDTDGLVVRDEDLPVPMGSVLFVEPVYLGTAGRVNLAIGALTWKTVSTSGRGPMVVVEGYSDLDDKLDVTTRQLARLAAAGRRLPGARPPYLQAGFDHALLAHPLSEIGRPSADPGDPPATDASGDPDTPHGRHQPADRDWMPAPDGSYLIDAGGDDRRPLLALAYAFWRLQAQRLSVVERPPLPRAVRRRAQQASTVHETRVVMLRRHASQGAAIEPAWHYRVRFVVSGHWRHLVDRDGRPYRIWINAYIKGSDGAPLLGGEKVSVLAR